VTVAIPSTLAHDRRMTCPICSAPSEGVCGACRETALTSPDSDSRVAEILGVSRQSVAAARRARELPRGVDRMRRMPPTTSIRVTREAAEEIGRHAQVHGIAVYEYVDRIVRDSS
jgi:hypothetical protein